MFLNHKTKLVCTIGPASDNPAKLAAMLRAGMSVARLNFSHGSFESHRETITRLRQASSETGIRLAIMADLPGPKMRIGEIVNEPVELTIGQRFTLTTRDEPGDAYRASVSFSSLPRVVKPGDKLFLNDGLISLKVVECREEEVECEVRAGGELSSRKGLNLPGIDLGMLAFTPEDRACLEFALEMKLDAVSQSFVASELDILAMRQVIDLRPDGHQPFIIAKIERANALDNLDAILEVTDGLMVARGDLGVEIPISTMPVVQKQIMKQARQLGKPVITATQMLESMTYHRRPTRAEATDVANAIMDGTDAVMLSGESAVGRYPIEAIEMLAEIAASTEPYRDNNSPKVIEKPKKGKKQLQVEDLIASSVYEAVKRVQSTVVVVPTRSGNMARHVTRYRLPAWIVALTTQKTTAQSLQFSYGVWPIEVEQDRHDWSQYVRQWAAENGLLDDYIVLTQGPSPENPSGNQRMELIDLKV
ncbi:pyruvate kinase [Ectothiorhodospiraceae bacterium BW-2]|nr:pyruvate kinase [Ectothiorhodospiraceae bacterium BW-2]